MAKQQYFTTIYNLILTSTNDYGLYDTVALLKYLKKHKIKIGTEDPDMHGVIKTYLVGLRSAIPELMTFLSSLPTDTKESGAIDYFEIPKIIYDQFPNKLNKFIKYAKETLQEAQER
jgi:hypothetical protein